MMFFIQFYFLYGFSCEVSVVFFLCKLIYHIVGSAGSGSQVRYSMTFVSPTLLLSSKFHMGSARWLK